jgi:hypothetical protein
MASECNDLARAVAQEQEPVLLAHRAQTLGGRAGDRGAVQDPLGGAADQAGRQAEAELVQQAGGGQLSVEGRAARARAAGGAPATVTTIGRATGEVKNGASQPSRQERVTTATGTRDGP